MAWTDYDEAIDYDAAIDYDGQDMGGGASAALKQRPFIANISRMMNRCVPYLIFSMGVLWTA